SLTVNTGGVTGFGNGGADNVGGIRALASLTTDDAGVIGERTVFNILGGTSVTTTTTQTYNDAVTLMLDTVLASTAAGNISFNSTVDTDAAALAVRSLTVNTGGVTGFGNGGADNVGGIRALASLTTDDAGVIGERTVFDIANTVVTLNADGTVATVTTPSVITTGAQLYGDAVVLAQDTVLRSTGAGVLGNITFNSTVDSLTAGSERLLAIETLGTLTFRTSVGSQVALSSLTAGVGAAQPARVILNDDPTDLRNVGYGSDVVTIRGQRYNSANIDLGMDLVSTESSGLLGGIVLGNPGASIVLVNDASLTSGSPATPAAAPFAQGNIVVNGNVTNQAGETHGLYINTLDSDGTIILNGNVGTNASGLSFFEVKSKSTVSIPAIDVFASLIGLVSTAGNVSQDITAGHFLEAANLYVQSGTGFVQLRRAGNSFGNVAGSAETHIVIRDDDTGLVPAGLTIGEVDFAAGPDLVISNANVAGASAGTLTGLTTPQAVGVNSIALIANGSVSTLGAAAITTNHLGVFAGGDVDITTSVANLTVLARNQVTTPENVSFFKMPTDVNVETGGITIAGIKENGGIRFDDTPGSPALLAGNLTVRQTGDLKLAGIAIGEGKVFDLITTAGTAQTVTQSHGITAPTFKVTSANGTIQLDRLNNGPTGNLGFSLNRIDTLGAVMVTAGDFVLFDGAGGLGLSGNITTENGGVKVVTTGGMKLANSLTLTAGNQLLASNDPSGNAMVLVSNHNSPEGIVNGNNNFNAAGKILTIKLANNRKGVIYVDSQSKSNFNGINFSSFSPITPYDNNSGNTLNSISFGAGNLTLAIAGRLDVVDLAGQLDTDDILRRIRELSDPSQYVNVDIDEDELRKLRQKLQAQAKRKGGIVTPSSYGGIQLTGFDYMLRSNAEAKKERNEPLTPEEQSDLQISVLQGLPLN
ncbi:hypothetical protein WJU23_10940, partial [Prosthecobacter sp. SYSU 5D2]|uniref:beta strand repeat-containing protein n=1 Tax=Prosthecobacter sp. SYSU 5D2 TaxID=3134134 RepID=UPI0031FF2D78